MRKIVLAIAVAGAALGLGACSQKTQDAAKTTGESAAADIETNADAAGDKLGDAVNQAGDAVRDAANNADQAGAKAEADVQDESTTKAKAD